MALTNSERQAKWRDKHRALFNLRRRQSRNLKSIARVEERLKQLKELRDGIEEPEVQTDVPRIEMPLPENPPPFETKKVGEFRMVVLPEEKPTVDAPSSTATRSRSDIAMGIWRNDQGGVISKFAWEKLQRLKEHAKKNNFEMDDYSQ